MSNNQFIHPTAIIDSSAVIASDVHIGPYCIIGPQVSIDEGTRLHSHVVVHSHTRIGKMNEIFPFASIGADCQDLKYMGEETWLEIGDYNSIREHCSLHRGTIQDEGITKIGSHNLLMVNTHIAHDCKIGSHNIFANNAGIAGHVRMGDYVVMGGNSGIHQFCHIDSYSMIASGSTIWKDVPAYVLAAGNPAKAAGLNVEGMRRKGWSRETIQGLLAAYKIIYKQGCTVKEAVELLEQEILPTVPEVLLLINSLKESTRGIVR
ncbi:MAG: acyl-ACP--UDP-N-acetylglucosamine O-acyltransferase [Acinetobacter sp.]|nr:acyl-ACP--UDP-N-acetylglucosamine O-acyltransferase [Acinetobacter sp.]